MSPLRAGHSPETIKQNALEMIRAGHPKGQAWAAAYSKAGKYAPDSKDKGGKKK